MQTPVIIWRDLYSKLLGVCSIPPLREWVLAQRLLANAEWRPNLPRRRMVNMAGGLGVQQDPLPACWWATPTSIGGCPHLASKLVDVAQGEVAAILHVSMLVATIIGMPVLPRS